MEKVYIGLGSNIEPRKEHLDKAVERLNTGENVDVTRVSSIYETDPVEYLDQADFLNQVVELKTSLDANALLDVCQGIESDLGRERIIDKGPRTIDLDILFYGTKKITQDRLEIPHPRIDKRAFVLVPLNELAPNLEHPVFRQSLRALLDQLGEEAVQGIKQWEES